MKFETMNNLVSIIIPCYNVEKYLGQCLSSILNQTYTNIQVILVNDGSTDETEKEILSFKAAFLRKGFLFDYIYQENKGVGFAVNTALKFVRGEYFCWIDADDWYDEKYVETVVNTFKNYSEYSIIRVNGYFVSDDKKHKLMGLRTEDFIEKTEEHMFLNCLRYQHISFLGAGGTMLKTVDFDKINPKREIYGSRGGQNYQLHLPMFYYYKVKFIDKPLQYILMRSDSLSREKCDYKKEISKIESYRDIQINTLCLMNIEDGGETIRQMERVWSKRLFYMTLNNNEFSKAKKYYKILKFNRLLTCDDKKNYRKRKSRIDYWLYLKNKIFGRNKGV